MPVPPSPTSPISAAKGSRLIPSASPMPRDGRRARRQRSADLAVDALLDLLMEGVSRPTAQQVSDRSGVSLRSIFRIFDDVETLHAAASRRQVERNINLFVDVPPTGPLAERITAIVEVNIRLYESVAPVRRAAIRAAPRSPALQLQMDQARDWLQAVVVGAFAPELAERDDAAVVAAALEMVLSFEAWDQLCSGQGLPAANRRAVVAHAVTALVG